MIDVLHNACQWANGVLFNPGGYSHTSVALRDAVAAIDIPVVEVHILNVYAWENLKYQSFISSVCEDMIVSFGWESNLLGLKAIT